MFAPAYVVVLAAFSLPVTAAQLSNSHFTDASWKPPRETNAVVPNGEPQIAMGFSPKPTGAPNLFGRMDMEFALGKRTLGSQTCGFSSDGQSFTCITSTAECATSGNFIGCCETGRSCNVIKTTCINYAASATGQCDLPEDFHTLCCGTSIIGECFTWVVPAAGAATTGSSLLTLFDCSSTSGSGTLLNYDPLSKSGASQTADDTESTDSASSTADDSASASASGSNDGENDDDGDDSKSSSNNVGPIVGGVVGGIAALGLIALAGFLLFRHRNKKPIPASPPAAAAAANAATGNDPQRPPAMTQTSQSPQQSFAASSPSNAAYPSGVPSNVQGGYQQPYDPNMAAAYGQQSYSPQPSFQGQYPHPGQHPSQYGMAGSISPHQTPSPGPQEAQNHSSLASQTHAYSAMQPSAQELPTVNPLGNENNRAELG